jgi:hypothetical protein
VAKKRDSVVENPQQLIRGALEGQVFRGHSEANKPEIK